MTHDEICGILEGALPEINRTRDPAGVLLKIARAQNMKVPHLEKLGRTFNILKTLSHLEKKAKTSGYDVLDVEKMIVDYHQGEPVTKTASFEAPVRRHFPGLDRPAEIVKVAAAAVVEEVDPLTKVSCEMLEQLEDDSRTGIILNLEHLRKLASLADQPLNTGYLLQDAASLYKDLPVLDTWGLFQDHMAKIAATIPIVKVAAADDRLVVWDRTGYAGLLKDAAEHLLTLRNCRLILAEKRATVADRDKKTKEKGSFAPPGGGSSARKEPDKGAPRKEREPKEDGVEKYMVEHPEDSSGGVKALENVAGTAEKAVGETGDFLYGLTGGDPVGGPAAWLKEQASNFAGGPEGHAASQRKIRGGQLQSKQQAALLHLMVRDPILSKANLQEVAQLATTVFEIAPDLSADPNTLRFILREAVQYGAVPPHTLKELSEIRKNTAESTLKERSVA